jgi:hypothetical protein
VAIIIEFTGGFRDGARMSSESDDPGEVFRARNLYFLSGNGKLGRKHRAISHATPKTMSTEERMAPRKHELDMNHLYEVVERIEKDGDMIVRFKYLSQEDGEQFLPPGYATGTISGRADQH